MKNKIAKIILLSIAICIIIEIIIAIKTIPKKENMSYNYDNTTKKIEPTKTINIVEESRTTDDNTKKEINEYISKEIKKYNWNKEQLIYINKLINGLSGYNMYERIARCYGLFLTCPDDELKKISKDYETNYKVQVQYGLDHIKKNYGTPKKAYYFWYHEHRF